MFVTGLACWACGKTHPAGRLRNLCDCGKPLRVAYDLVSLRGALTRESLAKRRKDLWRYREVLPLPESEPILTLGEGGTPLLPADRVAADLGMPEGSLLVKDEALNPTGSFKARGMALAVAMAKALGATKLAVPSAGNAGGALAAYAALHGLEAHVFMPRDVPRANYLECLQYGARVELVDGLITDCAKRIQERKDAEGWFDVSTLREPYRVEGKKTLGYEIAEHLDWQFPEAIVYPTGGGTGLIGMDKAFSEMCALGWIDASPPRMFAVQAEGCAPIVRAFEQGLGHAPEFPNASTVAAGLRVPRAIADFVILEILRRTKGGAVAVSDSELMRDASQLASATGIAACPEGGACLAGLRKLLASGQIEPGECVVLVNTGSSSKYAEAFEAYPPKPHMSE